MVTFATFIRIPVSAVLGAASMTGATKCKHTHTAFVEALNKILSERLFKVQDGQELNDPEKV